MKIKALFGRSGRLAAIIGATCAVGLGVSVPSALGQTAQQKSDFFHSCLEDVMTIPTLSKDTLQSFIDCCHLAGGSVSVDYDDSGNPTSFSCMMVADPAQVPQTHGLVNTTNLPSSVPNARAVMTSTSASGGHSNAGTNGLFQVVFTQEIIP